MYPHTMLEFSLESLTFTTWQVKYRTNAKNKPKKKKGNWQVEKKKKNPNIVFLLGFCHKIVVALSVFENNVTEHLNCFVNVEEYWWLPQYSILFIV